MKMKLKNELDEGTFVKPEVYMTMANCVEIFLERLSKETAYIYANNNERKISSGNVKEAFINVMFGRDNMRTEEE